MSIPKYDKKKYYRIMDRTQSNYANQLKRLSKDAKRADFILIYYSLAIIIYALSSTFYPQCFNKTWISYSSIIMSIIVLIYSIINSKAQYPERIYKIQVALNEVKRLKREIGALPDEIRPRTPRNTYENGNLSIEQVRNGNLCENCPQWQGPDYYAKFEKLMAEYNQLVNGIEVRDDLDFYMTIVALCKEYHLSRWDGKMKRGFEEPKPVEKAENESADAKIAREEIEEEIIIIKEIRGYISENNPTLQCIHIWLNKAWHICLYLAPIVIFMCNFFVTFR